MRAGIGAVAANEFWFEEECMARGRPRKSDDMLLRSAEMIGWAIGGLEREIAHTRERLATLTAQASQLRARAGRAPRIPAAPGAARGIAGPVDFEAAGRKRRKLSPEARKRISDMMKKRWAERKRKGKA